MTTAPAVATGVTVVWLAALGAVGDGRTVVGSAGCVVCVGVTVGVAGVLMRAIAVGAAGVPDATVIAGSAITGSGAEAEGAWVIRAPRLSGAAMCSARAAAGIAGRHTNTTATTTGRLRRHSVRSQIGHDA